MTTQPFPFRAATRWTALAAAGGALLFAAPLRAGDYISLAGLKAAGFQKFLDDAKDQGYEPIYVNGYNVGDHTEYAGVAVKTTSKTLFEARYDMTSDEYQDFFNDMSSKGYRPTIVSGYHTKGGPRFAAVWVKDKITNAWKARQNQMQKEYEDAVAAMRVDGLIPFCVTAYQGPDGEVRYTSLFYTSPRAPWETRHNLTGDQLADQVETWRSRGFRVWRVHAYDTPDGLRFLATARKKDDDGILWKERHGMSGKEYQKEFDKQGEEGYRPDCICGYREDGEVRFAAIWEKKKD